MNIRNIVIAASIVLALGACSDNSQQKAQEAADTAKAAADQASQAAKQAADDAAMSSAKAV
ncbi:MAG: hypothetical protein WAV67_08555, partial [Dokdonella sp.]